MAQVLSTKFYRFNNQHVVVEMEIDEAPELIVMSDFTIRTKNNDYDDEYGYIEDMHFLSKDGMRVIDGEIEDANENYSRVVAIFDIDSEEFKNEQYYLSTLYGYIKVGDVEEYPERLNKAVTFNIDGEIIKREITEVKKLSFDDTLKLANDGDIDAMIDMALESYREEDYDESIRWNLKLLSIDPNKAMFGALYNSYQRKGDKSNAKKYLEIGMEHGDAYCLTIEQDNNFKKQKYDLAIIGYTKILENIVADSRNKGESIPYITHSILKSIVDIFMLDSSYIIACINSLEDSLEYLANKEFVMAQFLLGMIFASETFGQGRESHAIELLLKCLEFKKEYDNESSFNLIFRKRAIQELLRIADPDDSRIAPYKSENIFLYEHKDANMSFGKMGHEDNLELDYECYMQANDPILLKNPLRKKNLYETQSASLCYATEEEKKIVNGANYYIYWRLRSSAAGNDEDIYPHEINSKDFDNYTHLNIMNEIMRLAANDDECKRIIEICQEQYPFLLPNNEGIMKEKKFVKDKIDKNDNRISEIVNVLKTDNLFQAQKLFKLKQYEAALKLFTQITEEETDTKRLKTAYKYLIKMHNKGLGVKKDKYYAVSLKNKMKML